MYAKQKFEKFYKKLNPLLYLSSDPDNEYIFEFEFDSKKYKIYFSYGPFYSSMFINNYEIYLYLYGENITLEKSNILEFRKKNKLTYDKLLSLFRKIYKIIQQK